MEIKITIVKKTREEEIAEFFHLRIYQHVDGEIVDGIINPRKPYVYQPGYKTRRVI